MSYSKTLIKLVVPIITSLLFLSTPAKAELISVFIDLSSSAGNKNDCSGYYGIPFDTCNLFATNANGEDVDISPIISKFEYEPTSGSATINSLYSSTVDGYEWEFSDGGDGDWSTGSFKYNPDDAADPGIRFYVAKASTGFTVHFDVDASVLAGDCATYGNNSWECMSQANVLASGTWYSWVTPLNDMGDPRGLSHISFYDTTRGPNEPPQEVPEPESLALFGLSLLGLVGVRRKYNC
ncbi:PEP-CTERM sorting domain-containing protein [Thalassotalea mangrovi]|uniref:PEP-CTERM sorting domain-containing protein n=1 Tax=Thalassotalea mangrovi TaxID=2572245 RepID=A0A4U1B3M0_9GAMM|nr:PEP-CTERM sorting domain-containing protein [Thalassotalea mangrovi]TKB43966.1 PEP-CTERM sorting domain-containing protein [Thalassotalea mangrovi]